MSNGANRLDVVAEELRRYCRAHPHAADTLDGIRGWLGALGPISRAELETVLEILENEATLERRTLPGGTSVYFSAAGRRGKK